MMFVDAAVKMNTLSPWTLSSVFGVVFAVLVLRVDAQPPGYFPQRGAETACLSFAMDFYNKCSGRAMRAGPLVIASSQMEALRYSIDYSTEMWYRFLGTLLMDTPGIKSQCDNYRRQIHNKIAYCLNTADNNGATPYICPVIKSTMADGSMPWNATCNFKVWYAPSLRVTDRFRMMYMMCD